MARYLISFDYGALGHIPEEEGPELEARAVDAEARFGCRQ
jgi:hypothetical protein